MKRFGPLETPNTSQMEMIDIPIGARCAWCEEPFTASDAGFALPFAGKSCDQSLLYYHEVCQMRQVVGSVAHQRRQCSCYVPGSTCLDPAGMTRRESAEAAAVEYFRRHGHA